MSNIIEKILSNELVEASRIFEEKMDSIKENKLYESKRFLAAKMHEAMGGKTIAQAKADIQARGMTPRKASDVLQDPRDRRLSPLGSKPTVKTKKKKVSEEALDEATKKSTAGIRGALQSSDPEVAKRASKKLSSYRMAIALSGKKGLGGEKAPKVSFMPKPAQQDVSTPSSSGSDENPKQSWSRRNYNTLMGRDPDYKPSTRGGRAGKATRGVAKLVGDFMSGLEEDVRPKRRIVVKKRKTILVTRKTDPHAKMGGGVQRIDKDKYNPKIHNLAVEE
jgi:hypothetical protein